MKTCHSRPDPLRTRRCHRAAAMDKLLELLHAAEREGFGPAMTAEELIAKYGLAEDVAHPLERPE